MASLQSPEGIFSLLDTDLYKLTMQCAVLKYFPEVNVKYKLTNRTPKMRLNRPAFQWLQEQVHKLGSITVADEELVWLGRTCAYLDKTYLQYLRSFKLKPDEQVEMTFRNEAKVGDEVFGEVSLAVRGLWVETILYEIPLLALVSEAYFKFVDTDWTFGTQVENAKKKGLQLIENGCAFSEFGSRRRRDYHAHALVMQGLVEAQEEANTNGKGWKGRLTGTSNVHMAMRFGVQPVGTVAHEWYMGIAAITDDYAHANELALRYWTATFGRGVLAIALTDTFGTPAFLRSFSRPAPRIGSTEPETAQEPTYAAIYTGVRQDSGDPLEYIKLMRSFYTSMNITSPKTIVFSDSLNVERCLLYKNACEAAGLTPSFGVGTFFTNDFRVHSDESKKSVPLNIVMKLSEAAGRPAIKLSDDVGKNMGDDALIKRIKKEVGYEEKSWVGGDEAHRWDK
jgi:nicotinate phosphoribosyltransferase